MTSDSFHARRTPKWLMVTSLVIGPTIFGVITLGFILDPSWFTGFLLAICTVNLVTIIVGWRNRARPLLEITDTEIRYAWRDWLPPRRVPVTAIEGIEFFGERRAVIRLGSGGRLRVQLRYIEPSSRGRALAALERVARTVTSPA